MAISDDKQADRLKRELEKFAAFDAAQIDETLRYLLADEGGQRLLWWLLEIGKSIGVQPYTANSDYTIFQCGEMNVGMQILARITDAHPVGFAEMQIKRKNEDEWRNTRASELASGNDLYSDVREPDTGSSAGDLQY